MKTFRENEKLHRIIISIISGLFIAIEDNIFKK